MPPTRRAARRRRQPATRERILAGAVAAVARHGLRKLDMGDVCRSSGVSRGTVYRYFPSRDALLIELARHEGERLQAHLLDALAEAPAGSQRILIVLEHATRLVREHPALLRMLETDPGLVLRGLQAQLPRLKTMLEPVLKPLLASTELVRRGHVEADDLVDWTLRLMVSAYLFPHPDPDAMGRALAAAYGMLATPRRRPPARRRSTEVR